MKIKNQRIQPNPIRGAITAADLVDRYFTAYNGARIREACQLLAAHIMKENVTVGWSFAGALTPAGLGVSCIIPLMEAGFIDWAVSTGANLYHDLHYALGMELYSSSPFLDDMKLREQNIIRIYDIVFDQRTLLDSDQYLYEILSQPEFQKRLGTSELHHGIGKYVAETERQLGLECQSVLAAANRMDIPVYTSSPGDSTIGMNLAAGSLLGSKLSFDVSRDVNETTAIVHTAKKRPGGESAVIILGGGSPKNFVLQTEPQLQEVLGISDQGHDYFLQFTDARPDTGGLSGATPSEALTWGKVTPEGLSKSIVAYVDVTVALPILTAYIMERCEKRPPKRLYLKRDEMYNQLAREYAENQKESPRVKSPYFKPGK